MCCRTRHYCDCHLRHSPIPRHQETCCGVPISGRIIDQRVIGIGVCTCRLLKELRTIGPVFYGKGKTKRHRCAVFSENRPLPSDGIIKDSNWVWVIDTSTDAISQDQSILPGLNLAGLAAIDRVYTVLIIAIGLGVFFFGMLSVAPH